MDGCSKNRAIRLNTGTMGIYTPEDIKLKLGTINECNIFYFLSCFYICFELKNKIKIVNYPNERTAKGKTTIANEGKQ